jgi:hypothetical protein
MCAVLVALLSPAVLSWLLQHLSFWVGYCTDFEGAASSDGPVGGGLAGKLAAGSQDALFELATCDETVRDASFTVLLASCLTAFIISSVKLAAGLLTLK